AFAVIQLGIGLTAGLALVTFEELPRLFLRSIQCAGSVRSIEVVQLVVSATVLLPCTLLIGASFPCAVAVWARAAGRAGEQAGVAYAVNTAGAIVGATLAGFFLVPTVGVQASLR